MSTNNNRNNRNNDRNDYVVCGNCSEPMHEGSSALYVPATECYYCCMKCIEQDLGIFPLVIDSAIIEEENNRIEVEEEYGYDEVFEDLDDEYEEDFYGHKN